MFIFVYTSRLEANITLHHKHSANHLIQLVREQNFAPTVKVLTVKLHSDLILVQTLALIELRFLNYEKTN